METTPFSETIDRAKLRDEEALTTLYNRFKPHISSYVNNYVNLPYVADDIVSGVFAELVEDIHTFRSNNPHVLHRWLLRVADARIADYYRSKERTTDPLDADKGPISWDDPALTIEIQERDTIIHQAVDKLSTDVHKVVIGRIVEGLPARTLALMLGKSEAAVRKIQERGLRTLKRALRSLLSLIVIGGLLIIGGALAVYFTSRATPQSILYPVRQIVFPSSGTGVTPTPTAIIVPSYILPPTPVPTPSPSPTPTQTPVPTPTQAPTQQTSQTPNLAQDLPISICVLGVCSH